ncbi:NusA antitermination factor [Thermanaerovibrio acidaminovorans DSM 6589]|jgi:N utilization substance protein A|uniref:Transcription termination/antitermination protein NusA n=1 Tax=Thermanaerovibrio acidaminovorans (strain ATCC 49978 / DSM 6589 / Su883) TaxID=525903 RepID=D1B5D7_THEAS|nr:transcription termination factor NusA [Thermanaerovibrio acidaminovorans]ACZ19228.1 NusA antitermination factor [Thermanaerovibrio acidaminovorans DSM 6589]
MILGREFGKALKQLEAEKGLSLDVISSSLEAALVSAYRKFKGGNQNVEVFIDFENGEIFLSEVKQVVREVTCPDTEISVEEAHRMGFGDVEEGDVIRIEVFPENFGRIAAQTARQVIIQRLKDAERQIIFEEFADRTGDLVQGTIFKVEGDQILVRLNDRTEAILPREERVLGEAYRVGDRYKFFLLDVRQTTKGPRIVVSRTHPGLLRKLFELEVPEIRDGIIEIKNVVREAGGRSKVAVQSLDSNVDPVGACVGPKGTRIKSVMDELGGERVDVIVWSSDPIAYVKNALSPAKVVKVEPLLDQERALRVFVRPDQLSLAIGKAGQNVRLAARLTGWKIDIKVLEPERLPTLKDLFEDIIAGADGERG